ncbi:hypothetical protein ACFX1X_012953 [Malus domestica]
MAREHVADNIGPPHVGPVLVGKMEEYDYFFCCSSQTRFTSSSSNPVKRKGKGRDSTNFPPKKGLIKAGIFGIGGRSNQACSSGGLAANCDTNSSWESSPSASYSSNGYD